MPEYEKDAKYILGWFIVLTVLFCLLAIIFVEDHGERYAERREFVACISALQDQQQSRAMHDGWMEISRHPLETAEQFSERVISAYRDRGMAMPPSLVNNITPPTNVSAIRYEKTRPDVEQHGLIWRLHHQLIEPVQIGPWPDPQRIDAVVDPRKEQGGP